VGTRRRTPPRGDWPQDADYAAESQWRNQPAIVNKAGKLYRSAIQDRRRIFTISWSVIYKSNWAMARATIHANPLG
jgi:hypothetical protein